MTPQAFFIRNHSASDLHKADLASLPTLSTRPNFATKPEYAKWCHDAQTQHVFYVMAEPENTAARSSGANRIKYLHGIVADYDGDPGVIGRALPGLKFPPGKAPTWVTTTFSQKARLIWVFERPVPVFNPDVFGRFMEIMKKDLKLTSYLPGLDEGALENPHTPYELGTDWRQPYGDPRIPNVTVMAAIHEASSKVKWKADGPEIPLEAVAAEVEKRWPGRWVGPFEDGAKGVRFWDEKADNPTGATIRQFGVQAWTGEGDFISWSKLLGSEFVKQYQANRIGGAIDGIYFDGRDYWQKDEAGVWRGWNGEAVKRRLGVMFGLSSEAKKGQQSEIAQATTTIENIHCVDGAFPCLFEKDTVVYDGSQRYLNITRAKPLLGTGKTRVWGEDFPWLASYIDGLFDGKQREIFLSWLSHFYQNAVRNTPRKGHALFIAGPRSAGKTFLSQRVIAALTGGFQEATRYVLGETSFNESLFFAPIWAVDDAVGSTDARRHALYTAIVKRIIANPYQEFHPKFKKAVSFKHNGRLVVTLNVDEESVAMLPATDNTILDKLVVLLCRAPGVSFVNAERIVERELPYFADFIMGYQIPDTCQTNVDETVRFGHDAFFHPDMLTTANDASTAVGLLELLNKWRVTYFRAVDKPEWSGTVLDLMGTIRETDVLKAMLKDVTRDNRWAMGKDMSKLMRQGISWISARRTSNDRLYIINRPEHVVFDKKTGKPA